MIFDQIITKSTFIERDLIFFKPSFIISLSVLYLFLFVCLFCFVLFCFSSIKLLPFGLDVFFFLYLLVRGTDTVISR